MSDKELGWFIWSNCKWFAYGPADAADAIISCVIRILIGLTFADAGLAKFS